MLEVLMLLQCLQMSFAPTTLRRLQVIVPAILAMSGRVTMLGISRWTGKGGSYCTIQRFFNTPTLWCQIHWACFCQWFLPGGKAAADDIYLIGGDETVVTKAGTKTFGLDRFFSSIFGKPVPGLSFFALSLISVRQRRSFPQLIRQLFRVHKDTSPATAASSSPPSGKAAKRRRRQTKQKKGPAKQGRPKGSKNTNKEAVELSPYLLEIQDMLQKMLQRVGSRLRLTYAVFDGAFGNNYALQMVRRCGLHLISKLQYNSALYFQYTGAYSGRGPRRKYGKKINYDMLPQEHLKHSSTEKSIRTEMYQMPMLHKLFPQLLNIVIIVKTNLTTHARAHVILFSSDLSVPYTTLIEYYKLRFQLEFNFRDAKQYWGLEDFMNIKEQPLTNAVNLSFFMVNVSHALLQKFRSAHPYFSLEDLKAHFRGLKYVEETLKLLPEKPDPILIQHISDEIAKIGSINVA
jgi:putative transposase